MVATGERAIITDKLVVEKTGMTMEEWFRFLDKKGAKNLTHKDIYEITGKTKKLEALGEWNRNLLTTSYEWSRGLKERGEKKDGIEISVSKTVNVPIDILYQSFTNNDTRKKWLKNKIVIRKATENKSARITWSDNITSLSVDFYSKPNNKSQVVVQHQKIASASEASELKLFWQRILDELKLFLESR